MRPLLLSLALLSAACTQTDDRLPPSDRFVYPSGIVHRAVPGSTNGVLYVSSANFDRCFDLGTLMAVDLDRVAGSGGESLQPLGAYTNPAAPAVELGQLNVAPESFRYIDNFAGEMQLWEDPGFTGAPDARLFIAARGDNNSLHYVDIKAPTQLSCVNNPDSNDCTAGALSLVSGVQDQQEGQPRADAPFGVFFDPFGIPTQPDKSGPRVWVTHLNPADSPIRSRTNFESYVVDVSATTPKDVATTEKEKDEASANPSVSPADFHPLTLPNFPIGGSNSVVADERYVFVTGRLSGAAISDTSLARRFLVRVLDKYNLDAGRILEPGLDLGFAASEARGLALTPRSTTAPSAPRRLYVAVRSPDTLLIVNVQGIEKESDLPQLSVVGAVPLPDGPTQVALVPRGELRSELVLVSCSDAGVVAIYDPDVGQVVAQVLVGERSGTQSPQPFGLAVQEQGPGARIFVSNFGDGRVSVIDIPDLGSPQLARLVAHLGVRQDVGESAQCQEEQL
ncbi:YncE family protein [Archangium gephyra]|uniref:YncE family protein n=1 Tax=Archangium gephyra TaxID=48 RepID=UPI003B818C60